MKLAFVLATTANAISINNFERSTKEEEVVEKDWDEIRRQWVLKQNATRDQIAANNEAREEARDKAEAAAGMAARQRYENGIA